MWNTNISILGKYLIVLLTTLSPSTNDNQRLINWIYHSRNSFALCVLDWKCDIILAFSIIFQTGDDACSRNLHGIHRRKALFILNNHYHTCWWNVDVRLQGINIYGANRVPCNIPALGIPLTLSQCTLAGPVYTGMPLVDPMYTGIPLGDPGYTGTPLEKHRWNSPTLECHWRNLVESAPHWEATGETLTFAAYTGTPVEGLWQPTHAPTHIVKHAE